MGEGQWGRRASDQMPGADARNVSFSHQQVPPPEVGPPSRNGRRDTSDHGGHPRAIGQLIAEFAEAAEDGVVLDPRGQPYTVEALREQRRALSYIDAELGVMAVQDVRRRHVQQLVTELSESGLAPARVLAVVDSLSALYTYAIRRDLVDFSPVVELQLPDAEGAVPHPYAPEAPSRFGTGDLPRAPLASMPPNGTWPPLPVVAPSSSWPPLGSMAPGDPRTAPPFMTPSGPWPPQPGPGYVPGAMGYAQSNGTGAGSMSAMFGSPGATGADASYDATMQERWLWWTVRIIVIVFVLIALVLAAESV